MRKYWHIIGLAGLLVAGGAAAAEDSGKTTGPAGAVGKSSVEAAAPLLDQLHTAPDISKAVELEAKIWGAWMTSGSDDIDKLVQQAVTLMQQGQLDDSLAVLDTVVAKAPGYAEGWNKRATVLYMMHQLDRSVADIGKVLALEPRHFGALSGLGLISMAKGDKAAALLAYKKVLEIDPQNPVARASVEVLGKELEGNPI